MSDSESDSENEKIHRKKKSVVVKFQFEDTSGSSSSSEEEEAEQDNNVAGPSNGNQRPNKKKSILNTSNDESTSDSDVPLKMVQEKRAQTSKAAKLMYESDEDSTDDSWSPVKNNRQASTSASMDTTTEQVEVSNAISDNANSSDSDSSSCDLMEKCPICLHAFREQEIGTPSVCEHDFCAPCIQEWSSNVQTCPIDRKPFTIIRVRSRYVDGVFVRETSVNVKTTDDKSEEMEFTHCEICNRSDREDIMLLCDGCDAGYHMDCLIPPLTEIPDGSWYCDNCFASETSDDDITQVLAEMETLAVPETRLRVRREIVPRITRTRQSERIRTTIRNRRQESQQGSARDGGSAPGPSRSTQTITTTTTTVTSTTTTKRKSKTVKRKVKKRRRKVQRKRRTYVVEYDVDEYNNKFGIKTANRIIRKRRRKTKKSKRGGCGRRKSAQNRSGSPIGVISSGVANKGLRKEYPTLRLFGNKNALEYFSDESENDEGIGSLNNTLETGDGLLIMSRARSSGHRNLIRRKNIAINSTVETAEPSGGVDILSNIMDTMNRWHSISRPSTIEKIRINADGSLECDSRPPPARKLDESAVQPNADVQNAPMNPRNDGAGNRNFNNSNGFQGNNTNQNAGNYSNNRFGGQNEATSFNPFQRGTGGNNVSNSGGGGGFGNNFQNESFTSRNRLPFQRQRNNLNNITSRLARNQMQSLPQLYDGEDILPAPNVPTQSDNDLNSPLKSGQQGNVVASNAQADQILPAAQEQIDENVECDSNDVHTEAIPPMTGPSQESNVASTTGEVSSSYEPPVSTTSGVSSSVNYSDSDDADDCPVFEYSAESMQVAKDSNDSPESTSKTADQVPIDESMENDEDLVQLDDDEHFANETGISDEQANQTQADNSQTIESPIASPETTTNTGTECSENVAMNYACESNEPPPNSTISNLENETEDVSETEAEADGEVEAESIEGQPSTTNVADVESVSNENNLTPKAGIEGMDTEMISEDEMVHDDSQKELQKTDKEENNNRKSDRDESFKKVSKNNKDRNYRDKREKNDVKGRRAKRSRSRGNRRSRSRSSRRSSSSSDRSRSRSRSRNRSNRRNDKRPQRKDREKRKEIQRYDVRTLIADRQPRNYKDKYGRDTSRQRSLSPRRVVKSKSRSISRSVSPGFSARRRSLSRRRRSLSRRSSVRRRRSISRGRRSISRTRGRRSVSGNRRRKSISRSPMYYTSSRSRSYSRGRRLINGQSRSKSRSSRSYTPKPVHGGTLYHMHDAFSRSRSRSRDKKTKKKVTDKRIDKKNATKGRSKKKARSPIHSPMQRGGAGGYTPLQRRRSSRSRSKSWNEAASWNRSLSDVPNDANTSWTPPIAHVPENLTVILKNKDSGKRSKRDKKRKVEKRKTDTMQKKEKRKRTDKQSSPSLPSKEVFASGDNILVSVSFNKDKPSQPQQQTTIVTLPPTKEQVLGKKTSDRDRDRDRDRDGNSKRSRRTARDAPRKHRKVNIKPVAIIDLDNSPFKEVTPSPRAVIILSDSDHENDKLAKNASHNYSMASNASETISNDKHHSSIETRETNIRVSSPPQSPTAECADFELPLGPKTPPEPSHLVKFSISSGTKMKIVRTVVNPLHDDNDDDDDEDDHVDDDDDDGAAINSANKESNNENAIGTSADKVQISSAQSQPKVGPNTPPGPCSPDVYDPFEPTKSPSQSPSDSIRDNVDEPQTSTIDDGKSTKSVDLSMALINSKASIDAANTLLSNTLGGEDIETDIPNDEPNTVSPYKEKPIDDGFRETAAPKSSGIHVFSNVLLTPAKDSSRIQTQPSQSRTSTITITNLSTSVSTISATKQSPMKFPTGSIISKLPLPKITKPQRHNGNDDNMDIESPYSPGSSDYEDWFEPPQNSPPTGASHSKHTRQANKSSGAATTSGTGKVDIFDDLFGSSSPPNKLKNASKRRPSKHSSSIKDWIAVSKHSTQISGYGKLNEEQLRILDDVPGSAVELQAKDKFLRKLNRQERVIEEVKLVLKPHYNKKHVTKDEYKDIMRRAVPKICHNRTGEINPKKIKKLIEAYVGKFRQKRKFQQSTNLVIK